MNILINTSSTKSNNVPSSKRLTIRDINDHHAPTNKLVMKECQKFRKGASRALNKFYYWYRLNKKRGIFHTDFYITVLAEQMDCSVRTAERWVKEACDQSLCTLEKIKQKDKRIKYRVTLTEKFLTIKELGINLAQTPDTPAIQQENRVPSPEVIIRQNAEGYEAQDGGITNVSSSTYNIENNKSNKSIYALKKLKKLEKKAQQEKIEEELLQKNVKIAKEERKANIIHPPERMLEIFHNEVNPPVKVPLTKKLARFLNAALKWKFNGSIHKWLEYCRTLATSDFLMGKFKNGFKVLLETALKFSFIDKVLQLSFGVRPVSLQEPKDSLKESLIDEIDRLDEPEKAKKFRLKLLKQYGVYTYKSWFQKLKFLEADGTLYRKERNRFEEDWLKNHYPELDEIRGDINV